MDISVMCRCAKVFVYIRFLQLSKREPWGFLQRRGSTAVVYVYLRAPIVIRESGSASPLSISCFQVSALRDFLLTVQV